MSVQEGFTTKRKREDEYEELEKQLLEIRTARFQATTEDQIRTFVVAGLQNLIEKVSNLRKSSKARALLRAARSQLALTLYQDTELFWKGDAVATALGCKYKLARAVMSYDFPEHEAACVDGNDDHRDMVRVLDKALSAQMLARLARAFAPRSAFWSEHQYDAVGTGGRPLGYFSYVHALAPTTSDTYMDTVIDEVYKLACDKFEDMRHARYAEWWAHCRPHSSGHQMHFDSDDEGNCGVRNPICSTVIYLTRAGLGGPTLVTDQTLASTRLAEKGWLCHPRYNRVCMFDGKLLHGVVPGRGPVEDPSERRVSLMIAFWRDIQVRGNGDNDPGAARSFPSASATYSWPRDLKQEPSTVTTEDPVEPTEVLLARGRPVWEDVDRKANGFMELSKLLCVPSYALCFQGF
ncbi:hypothetical protein CYMTET_51323 [Cymbomonas tetramitiformis]|uniref:Uncharacterized protein n=1 Tax=Cymbomonas tetramitiformis TaxID=36881 RepID=A0AAE0BLF6_9CHLO|nr:hypothetical protein CYMTET_51323 [Cymbomonas tetramitiformis]